MVHPGDIVVGDPSGIASLRRRRMLSRSATASWTISEEAQTTDEAYGPEPFRMHGSTTSLVPWVGGSDLLHSSKLTLSRERPILPTAAEILRGALTYG